MTLALKMADIRYDAFEEGLEQGREDGFQVGFQDGVAKGFEQGIEQGIKQGINSRNIEIAKNMIDSKIELNIISKCTGLSKEELENLR